MKVDRRLYDLFGAEAEYVAKLGSCFSDPEQKKAFWDAVREKKMKDPRWSIYDDYPKAECSTKRAMRECCSFVKGLRKFKEEESA